MVSVKLDDDFTIEKTGEGYVMLDSGRAVLGPFSLSNESAGEVEQRTGAAREAEKSGQNEGNVLPNDHRELEENST